MKHSSPIVRVVRRSNTINKREIENGLENGNSVTSEKDFVPICTECKRGRSNFWSQKINTCCRKVTNTFERIISSFEFC